MNRLHLCWKYNFLLIFSSRALLLQLVHGNWTKRISNIYCIVDQTFSKVHVCFDTVAAKINFDPANLEEKPFFL